MKQNLKHLVSMALCCVLMLAAPLLLGVAGALGWRTGVFGIALTALAVLACPVSMGLMMWQMSRHSKHQASVSPQVTGEAIGATSSPAVAESSALPTAGETA